MALLQRCGRLQLVHETLAHASLLDLLGSAQDAGLARSEATSAAMHGSAVQKPPPGDRAASGREAFLSDMLVPGLAASARASSPKDLQTWPGHSPALYCSMVRACKDMRLPSLRLRHYFL